MRIIRFLDEHGTTAHGEDAGDGAATVFEGSIAGGFAPTARRARVCRLLAPLVPTDIICIGRNYRSLSPHAKPDPRDGPHPTQHPDDATLEVFLKPSTSLQNPGDPILIPRFDGINVQLDCEGELAMIIGREAHDVSEQHALDHVFGYTIANDITARHFQTPTGPPLWMRGKGFDTFCPLGPAIITADELPEPQSLAIRTLINGGVVRDGHTRDMIRRVPQIIAALSRHMTLRSGAVVLTGAPPGAPQSLRDGDVLEVDVNRIGRLANTVRGEALIER